MYYFCGEVSVLFQNLLCFLTDFMQCTLDEGINRI